MHDMMTVKMCTTFSCKQFILNDACVNYEFLGFVNLTENNQRPCSITA